MELFCPSGRSGSPGSLSREMPSLSVPTLRVASVPLPSRRGDTAQNVTCIEDWLDLAAHEAIGLVVFPEACLAGYGSMAKLHRDELEALAEPLDGPSAGAIHDAVERTGVAAGVGLIERVPDGRLFNSYVVCMPGGLRYCHRKLHAFEHRRIVSGDRFTVFDTLWGIRIGILIGGDNYLVENVRMTALMGATLLIAPHRSYGMNREGDRAMQPVSMEQWLRGTSGPNGTDARGYGVAADGLHRWLPARAGDNGMFVAFSDGVEADNNDAAPGRGMIVDPSGRILAEGGNGGGAIISADLDLGLAEASAGQRWLKARRPELYEPLGRSAHHAARFEPRGVSSRGSIALSFAQVTRNR
jgi:predicted amidohydrolase